MEPQLPEFARLEAAGAAGSGRAADGRPAGISSQQIRKRGRQRDSSSQAALSFALCPLSLLCSLSAGWRFLFRTSTVTILWDEPRRFFAPPWAVFGMAAQAGSGDGEAWLGGKLVFCSVSEADSEIGSTRAGKCSNSKSTPRKIAVLN